MKFSKITLALALALAGIGAAQAAQVTLAAGPSVGVIDGLGYHNRTLAGVTLGGNIALDSGINLNAKITRAGGRGWTECDRGGCVAEPGPSYGSISAGASYSVPLGRGFALVPEARIGKAGFACGAQSEFAAVGGGLSYAVSPSVSIAGDLLHGRTRGVDAASGRLPGGQYQSGALALVVTQPWGDLSVSYARQRMYIDSIASGDQYLRTDLLNVAYSRAF
jgi:hypothetical protein